MIEETERLLRGNAYLYDVDIRPVAYHDGVVDIEVQTRDTWSLDLGVSAQPRGRRQHGPHRRSRKTTCSVPASRSGWRYASDVDRSSTEFKSPTTTCSAAAASVAYAYATAATATRQSLSLQRPFYALDTRWAAGFSAGDSDRHRRASTTRGESSPSTASSSQDVESSAAGRRA